MQGGKIRKATIDDLEKIYWMDRLIFPETTNKFPRGFYEKHLKNFNRGLVVYELKGKVVGFLHFIVFNYDKNKFPKNFIDFEHDINGNALWGHSIGIVPEHRRNNIGKKFHEHLEKEAINLKKDRIVAACDEKSMKYHSLFGFKSVKILSNFYGPNLDYHLITKEINPDPATAISPSSTLIREKT